MIHGPNKSLGQHFLIDDNVVRKILNAFSPRSGELVVEIGPGEGALTRYLAEMEVETLAVEVDERLVDYLRDRLGKDSSVRVRHQDILTVDFLEIAAATGKPVRVLGNLPYNITSPILFRLAEQRAAIQDAWLMVQKEIADRVSAGPATKEYGILSVLLQTYADVRSEFTVSRHVFRPRPQVASAMLSLQWHDRWSRRIPDPDLYRVVVRTAFGKRRKTLRNALQYLPLERFDPDVLASDTGRRAEELTVEDFIALTGEITEHYPGYKDQIDQAEL